MLSGYYRKEYSNWLEAEQNGVLITTQKLKEILKSFSKSKSFKFCFVKTIKKKDLYKFLVIKLSGQF